MCPAWPGVPKIAQPPSVSTKEGTASPHEHEPGFPDALFCRDWAVAAGWGRSAGHQAERVAGGISVDAPRNCFPGWARLGGHVLASKCGAGSDDALVSGGKVTDQNVEMNQRRYPGCGRLALPGADPLKREPLAMRGGLQGDPAGIPLHRGPAQQPGPEVCQGPRIRTIQHDLAYPPDYVVAVIVHHPMMTGRNRQP